MPEGPEVETVRRGLHDAVLNRTVVRAVATGRRSVRRYGDGPAALRAFEKDVSALRFTGTSRRGKYLLIEADRGTLIIHLRMSGQVLVCSPHDELVAHTHVVLELDDGQHIRFVDPRTFGEVWRTDDPDNELSHIGPDAQAAAADVDWFVMQLRKRRMPVKSMLLDQRFVAGIGNIYSDEILHRAGVRPFRPSEQVSKPKARAIALATIEVLEAAIQLGGSSLRDGQYVDVQGNSGRGADMHLVYAQINCGSCGAPVRRTTVGGRTAHWCPRCQR
jgi:formamidopyrimidine-DNA glycosylase